MAEVTEDSVVLSVARRFLGTVASYIATTTALVLFVALLWATSWQLLLGTFFGQGWAVRVKC
jgi:ABC-type bacteriocin/lantibiotic exporter with double-glycine peptidase domain